MSAASQHQLYEFLRALQERGIDGNQLLHYSGLDLWNGSCGSAIKRILSEMLCRRPLENIDQQIRRRFSGSVHSLRNHVTSHASGQIA